MCSNKVSQCLESVLVSFSKAKKTLKLAKFQDIVFQSHIPNIVL